MKFYIPKELLVTRPIPGRDEAIGKALKEAGCSKKWYDPVYGDVFYCEKEPIISPFTGIKFIKIEEE